MYCHHCGKEIHGNSKFCSTCGKALDVKRKPAPLIVRIFAWMILLLMLPLMVIIIYHANLSLDDKQANSIFVATVYLYFLVPFIISMFWLKKLSIVTQKRLTPVIFLVMIVWFLGLKYGAAQFGYMRAADKLPQLQNYLIESTAAKLMGDSIYAGHPVSNVTYADIANIASTSAERLTTFSTLSWRNLDNYRQVALGWTNEIAASAKNTYTWKKLPAQPADFKLSLNDAIAKQWFKTSIQNIQLLKEFGDDAIKRKDKETMFYIAAKLLVQKHWLNGIIHSQKANFLTFNLVDKVLADDSVYCQGIFLHCMSQTCPNDINCASNCGAKRDACSSSTQPESTQQPPVRQIPQNQTVNENQPAEEQPETQTPSSSPYNYDSQTRVTCIQVRTGSYCAEETAQSVNEIAASAIGFAEDQPNAEKEWDDSWHNLEAIGEITPNEPTVTTAEHSPRVQAFYNDCTAKGSFVGGTNQNKGRLPTTESGYHCNYKREVNNCWDFLTYSGGRFMGGDVGCQEKNLVPLAPVQKPAQ